MLQIDTISKGFGDQVLLDGTGFQINPGERVGLVGRNGHGKTTLLNMIAGTDHPDEGKITWPTGYRMGILSQKIEFSQPTIIKEAMLGLPEHERDHYWKAEKILAGLGFSNADMEKSPDLFSGGYQVRLNLAKVLVSEPDLLILDEPTNYLDITSIRWISQFLISWPREVLLVTHDRGFMDNVVTHIAGIHRHKIRKIKGDTAKYYEQVAQDEEVYEKTRQNEAKKRKEIETFITRFRAKARLANMVQSRVKTLEKTQVKDKLQEIRNMEFSFNDLPFAGKQLMQVEDLSFGYDPSRPLINDLSFTVYPQDRIGVIGQNGKGKTTLLKLLSKGLELNQGKVQLNPGVSMGYFEQTNVQTLNPRATIEEEVMNAHPDFDRQAARNICGSMMFEGDSALKPISVLSGGEKARVMLGKLLLTPLNLLLLDEPSNHLDIEACDAFVAALSHFDGAVLIVTHNELFLHAIATKLLVFKKDGISLFEGSYQEFLEKEGWEDEERPESKKSNQPTLSRKQLRQKKSEIIAKRSKVVSPLKKAVAGIENKIEENEEKIAEINQDLLEAAQSQNGDEIQKLSKGLAQLEAEVETLFLELEEKTEEMDMASKEFDEQLEALER
ncbi:MAG: ABC-F family ATP-binding cassette domain-containing protein [Desulfobacterales bacterium]|nr:ABC-F family ATP-binding cassette domain-containing protein [Desulfobacterales bacterium]